MLYHGENPILRITAVEHMCWKAGNFQVAPRSYSALAFRIRGTAAICCREESHLVNTNDVLYIPQELGYCAEYTDTEIIAIHFVTAQPDRNPEVYTLNNSEEVYKLFLQAHVVWKGKEPGYRMHAMALLYRILGTVLEKETRESLPEHFLNAVSCINAGYQNGDISVPKVCRETGISETAFRQLFKKHYQKTPVAYITDLRLERARGLISGGMPVVRAAMESGFNDPKYFARVVKKRFSCTPRELKNYGK